MTVLSTGSVKFALIAEFAVRFTEQSTAVPLQLKTFPVPSVQPVNVELPVAVARKTNGVPLGYEAAHAANPPPFALHVTEPVPEPPFGNIVTVAGGGAIGKVAVVAASALSVITQLPVPEQPAPAQLNPVPVAVNVTTVPVVKTAEQVPAVQLIPAGFEVTVPLFTIVTAIVLKDVPKCVLAVGSETSGRPGNEASNPAAEKSIVAGKLAGGVTGT
ncbi:MAG: hypothetical protein H8K08_00855 [Nitrospira sp.]|nr:hypothetical protein [Nitrospira sp.]